MIGFWAKMLVGGDARAEAFLQLPHFVPHWKCTDSSDWEQLIKTFTVWRAILLSSVWIRQTQCRPNCLGQRFCLATCPSFNQNKLEHPERVALKPICRIRDSGKLMPASLSQATYISGLISFLLKAHPRLPCTPKCCTKLWQVKGASPLEWLGIWTWGGVNQELE